MKHQNFHAWPNFTRIVPGMLYVECVASTLHVRSAVFVFSIFFAHSSIAKIFFNCRGGLNKV